MREKKVTIELEHELTEEEVKAFAHELSLAIRELE